MARVEPNQPSQADTLTNDDGPTRHPKPHDPPFGRVCVNSPGNALFFGVVDIFVRNSLLKTMLAGQLVGQNQIRHFRSSARNEAP
jgi:hypothetical protein